MKVVSHYTEELLKKIGEMTEQVVTAMLQKSSLEADLIFEAGPFHFKAILATQEMMENALAESSRDGRGNLVDPATREIRLQRAILASVLKEIEGEVEFEIGNDEDNEIKKRIFARLPEILVTQMYAAYTTQRAALMLVLARSGADFVKKSPASLSGESGGDSSRSKDELPSLGTSSQTSTPSNSSGQSTT
jgi:hypothetical protein